MCFHPGRFLESLPTEQRGPLWGIPFAVKVSSRAAGAAGSKERT